MTIAHRSATSGFIIVSSPNSFLPYRRAKRSDGHEGSFAPAFNVYSRLGGEDDSVDEAALDREISVKWARLRFTQLRFDKIVYGHPFRAAATRPPPDINEIARLLRLLNIKSDVPEDLSRTFRAEAKAMPRARLGGGSWQFEDDKLAALRAKIKVGKKTLGGANIARAASD